MKELKNLFFALSMMLPLSAMAAEYQWLTFRMTDDTEVSVAADKLSINYSDAMLRLKSATVDETLAVAQIKSMRFTSSSAGINEVKNNHIENADYYTVGGIKVGHFTSIEEARENLPSGVYIGKTEAKTFKVIF